MVWEDRQFYILNKAPQMSPTWFKLHDDLFTASRFGLATGSMTKIYDKENEKDNPFTAAKFGIETEIEAKTWYAHKWNVIIKDVGIAIPKWNTKIGASIDGEILTLNKNIEVKCPLSLYKNLIPYSSSIYSPMDDFLEKTKHFNNKELKNIIFGSHWDQIQGQLAITNKQYCDYIVYAKFNKKVFVATIYFDMDYWSTVLYPSICTYLKNNEGNK